MTIPTLFDTILALIILALLIATIKLCWPDARRRGLSPLLVTALIILTFPLGMILWILFRPDPPSDIAAKNESKPESKPESPAR